MENLAESLQFYPYEIIGSDGKQYLFNAMTSGIFELDDLSHRIMTGSPIKEADRAEAEETIAFMKSNFIIKTPENEDKLNLIYSKVLSGKNKMTPRSLMLMVSQECNLRCTYCYGVNGEYNHKGIMSIETAKKAIDCFIENSAAEKLNICFFGGEPLIKFDMIKDLVAYAKEQGEANHKTIGFSMTTNATLISPEVEKFIMDHKIYTTISIDGNELVQNTNRYYANKKGCYADVIQNTENLRKTNLLSARATISRDNVDVYHHVNHLIDVGFKRVSWALALNLLEETDVWEIVGHQKRLIAQVKTLIDQNEIEQAKKYGSVIDMLSKLYSDGIRTKGCGAGNNIMTVNIDGNIYPCHRFVGNDEAKLGNIDNFDQCGNEPFYANVGLNEFEKCQSCFAKNTCAGGCINENFEYTGAINDVPEARCIYFREVSRAVIELYITLNEDQKEKLFGKPQPDNNLAKVN